MSIQISINAHNKAILQYENMNGRPKYRFITRLYVPPSFRRIGYGSRLIENACKIADEDRATFFIYVIPPAEFSRSNIMAWLGKYDFKRLNDSTLYRPNGLQDISLYLEILSEYERD